jgi:hypothetical protein
MKRINQGMILNIFWQYTELFIKGNFTAYFRTAVPVSHTQHKKIYSDQCNEILRCPVHNIEDVLNS